MARFRKKRASSRRGFGSFRRRSRSRSSGSGISVTGLILPSMAYGAVREKISSSELMQSVSARVPIADIGDELVLGAVAYFGAKKLNNKMAKDFCRAALVVESARVGEAVLKGGLLGNTGSSSSSGEFQ